MSSADLAAASQSLIDSDEPVLAAGIFTIPDSASSLAKGSIASMVIPGDANPVLSGAGSVAALEMARVEEAHSKGLTERMVVAVTENAIHLLALPHVGKTPERELVRFDRDEIDVKISRLGLSKKLKLTHRDSGNELKLMGYTAGPTEVAKGDKTVFEALA